jgi:hypothetical protein
MRWARNERSLGKIPKKGRGGNKQINSYKIVGGKAWTDHWHWGLRHKSKWVDNY